ncbi:hypothetical protein BIV23_08800 [Streptomyces monashensis]|uniref:Uncharacterized protein n=1 Tax=Streptomyces monashensis TaxID=1678012 RepID=A0A1S2QJ40_9ACTN|nr:hypothetical protein BIV23_08800 [Streptomyces monashensis]
MASGEHLTGRPVIGIGTPAAPPVCRCGTGRATSTAVDELTMVEAVADDTQRLLALDEICLGTPGHQTVRYRLGLEDDGGVVEAQASSWVLGPAPARPAGSAPCGRSGAAGSR